MVTIPSDGTIDSDIDFQPCVACSTLSEARKCEIHSVLLYLPFFCVDLNHTSLHHRVFRW